MNKENYTPNEDCDDNSEPKTRGSSRLGKEAKIGVSVIGMLLLILGVAVTMRLTNSNADEPQVAVADEVKESKLQHSGPSTAEAILKDTGSKHFGSPGSPIIVPKAAAGKAPKSPDSSVDKWKLPSERADAKPTSTVPTSPPSFMPTPPAPPKGDRYDRYAASPSIGNDKAEVKPLPGARPLRPHDSQNDSHSAASKKSVAPDNASGGYASVEPPATLPGYRDRARIEESAAPPPVAQPDSGSPFSAPPNLSGMGDLVAATPTQYDAGDYRADPPATRSYGSDRRRPAAMPSYAAAPQRSDGKYEVQPNDSYWTVSERLYGTGAYFKALAQQNRGKGGEDQLRPGELILAPTVAQLEQAYPDLCPKAEHREAMQSQARTTMASSRNRGGRSYTVVEGDTLFNIARYELGKASRWAELYDLNRDVLGKDFNYLRPGTQLTMPESERVDSIARPPNRGYTR